MKDLIQLAALSALLSLQPQVGAQENLDIEFTTVGDPGNPPDPFTGNQFGDVAYEFQIGVHEITNAEYSEFLNRVDPLGGDQLDLYHPNMSSSFGGINLTLANPAGQKYSPKPGRGNRPVNFVDYYSAARFVNWLHGGDTEDGVYEFTEPKPFAGTLRRLPGAKYWLPNRDEWYKAAYYHGLMSDLFPTFGTDYSVYPMGGFIANNDGPTGDGDSAQYGRTNGSPVNVGSFTEAVSYYGTFDQGGNVEEWIEVQGNTRRALGGHYSGDAELLRSTESAEAISTTGRSELRGFRVASARKEQPPVVPDLEIKQAVELCWLARADSIYQFQYSTDLKSWFNEGDQIEGDGSEISLLRTIDDLRRYWRVVVIQ